MTPCKRNANNRNFIETFPCLYKEKCFTFVVLNIFYENHYQGDEKYTNSKSDN